MSEPRVPDHPLVRQTIQDCLVEAMDLDGLVRVLDGIERDEIQSTAIDTVEPSVLAHEVSARPSRARQGISAPHDESRK